MAQHARRWRASRLTADHNMHRIHNDAEQALPRHLSGHALMKHFDPERDEVFFFERSFDEPKELEVALKEYRRSRPELGTHPIGRSPHQRSPPHRSRCPAPTHGWSGHLRWLPSVCVPQRCLPWRRRRSLQHLRRLRRKPICLQQVAADTAGQSIATGGRPLRATRSWHRIPLSRNQAVLERPLVYASLQN